MNMRALIIPARASLRDSGANTQEDAASPNVSRPNGLFAHCPNLAQ